MALTALALLAELESRGVTLETDGRRIRWRPAAKMPDDLAVQVTAMKAELVSLLDPAWCGSCGGRVDDRRRCWRCCDRPCVRCSRPTGSAFIAHCDQCGRFLT